MHCCNHVEKEENVRGFVVIFPLQLEDDIVATPSFASTIKTFALQQETNEWLILEFSALGFIGKNDICSSLFSCCFN